MFGNLFSRKSLPVLSFTADLYKEADLSGTVLIACQHLLGTTYDMFEELFKKGLKPENTYLIGKCYSTHEGTLRKFLKRGVNVSQLSTAFDSHLSFDEQFQGYIATFIHGVRSQLEAKTFERMVILDDGAELLLYVNDFFKDFERISGVEQTSNGYTKLQDVRLKFPVINVARSKAKLELESPLIAKLAERKVREHLYKSRATTPNVLVVGLGYIGQALFELLKTDHSVARHDIVAHKSDLTDYKNQLKDFDVIIGASGQTIINPGDFGKLKSGATLISVSSSDREFSAVYLRRLSTKTTDCHKDFLANGITLLNGGFPINFDGNEHSMPPIEAQLTRSLLLAGVIESLSDGQSGLCELPPIIQQKITDRFVAHS